MVLLTFGPVVGIWSLGLRPDWKKPGFLPHVNALKVLKGLGIGRDLGGLNYLPQNIPLKGAVRSQFMEGFTDVKFHPLQLLGVL